MIGRGSNRAQNAQQGYIYALRMSGAILFVKTLAVQGSPSNLLADLRVKQGINLLA